jgi:hypothetical protein
LRCERLDCGRNFRAALQNFLMIACQL